MACFDTTLLIDLSRGASSALRDRARRKLREINERQEPFTTTRFNVAELWVGVARSDDPDRENAAVEEILSGVHIFEFDGGAARMFGKLTAVLQRRGQPIGDMDVLIAAVALANGQSLITRNARHFASIPGLTVESY